MNKNKNWLVALGVAAMITVNGIAMAAVTTDQQDIAKANGKGHAFVGKEDRPGMKGFKEDQAKLLTLLKIDKATFRAEIKEGKTLAAIAQEQGVSEQALKNFLVEQMTKRLEEGVKTGRLSAEQAEKMKTNMDTRVTDMINGKGPMHRGMHGHAPFENAKLLALLNIDAETLKNDLKAEKTLAAIAQEHGVSEQALKDFLTEQMVQRIDQGVKSGKLPAEKAEKMKANIDKRVDNMINGKGHMHRGHGPKSGSEGQPG